MWHVVPKCFMVLKYFKLPEIPLGTWASCHCVGSLTSVTTRWQVAQQDQDQQDQDQQDQPRLQDLESLSTQATATLPSFLRNFENLLTPHRLLILVSFLQSIYFDLHIFQCIFVTQPVKSSNVQSAVFHWKHSKSKNILLSFFSVAFLCNSQTHKEPFSSWHFFTDSLYHSLLTSQSIFSQSISGPRYKQSP